MQFQDNAAPVEIGSSSPVCSGNKILGNVSVSGNTAAVQLIDNVVTGDMSVDNNTGPTQVKGNAVHETLSCVANSDLTVSGPNPGSPTIQGQCH
jgi:hypothetical protein